jgi:hypothetical protein
MKTTDKITKEEIRISRENTPDFSTIHQYSN